MPAQAAPSLADLRWGASETPAGRFTIVPGERAFVAGYRGARCPKSVKTARSRAWAMVAGLLVVATLGVGTYWATRTRGPSLTLGKSSQFTTDAGLQINPALSPDGKFVAYAAGTSSKMRIYVRPTCGGRTIALTDDSSAVEDEPRSRGITSWSPDGRQILTVTERDVVIVPVDSGASRTIYSATDDRPRAGHCQYSVTAGRSIARAMIHRDAHSFSPSLPPAVVRASSCRFRISRGLRTADLSVGAKALYVVIRGRHSTVWLADVVR